MGEYYGRFLFFENQTPPPVIVDDDDDDTPVVPGVRRPDTDLDGLRDCFIDTAGGSHDSIFSRAAAWIHNAITAMLK
jgi:hypothetical protein